MSAMKLINYRGGIARFYLPTNWVEEYDQDGRGTFFEDKPDSGTLRVSIIELDEPRDDLDTVDDVVAEISATDSIERLPGGVAVAQTRQTVFVDGSEVLWHTWHIGIPVGRAHFRIIIFTHAIRALQQFDPHVCQELAMLNRSIAQGAYPAVRMY
jgi:hypothetical protein